MLPMFVKIGGFIIGLIISCILFVLINKKDTE